MTKTPIHCGHLDQTGGMQCGYEGPYRYQNRGRPSCARVAFGDRETSRGVVHNMPFLQCEPAEEFDASRGTESQFTYGELVNRQGRCSKFEEKA